MTTYIRCLHSKMFIKFSLILLVLIQLVYQSLANNTDSDVSEIFMVIPSNELSEDLSSNGWLIKPNTLTKIFLIGNEHLSSNDLISFTSDSSFSSPQSCIPWSNDEHFSLKIIEKNSKFTFAESIVKLPALYDTYHLCMKPANKTEYFYQNRVSFKTTNFEISQPVLPPWLQLVIAFIGIFFSFYLSGLALGIMSIDITDLLILMKEGTPIQMRHAEVLLPIRRDGNRLLSTLLLSNVAANALVTIFLNQLLDSGWLTFIISTLALCLIGEIVSNLFFFFF